MTTIPFFHTSSKLKADNSLSKADSVPWTGTNVIVTKLGSALKGYTGVVKDVLRGQETASGLRISIQLAHLDPSSPFRTILVNYDDVVEQRSVNDLLIRLNTSYAYFKDWMFTFRLCKAPKRSFPSPKGLYEVSAPAFT